jgi:ribosome-binding factor A
VASTIQQAVQQVLAKGLADPRVDGLITVTKVTVSDDLKAATVWVSVLPQERQKLVVHGLSHAAAHIRRQVGDLVSLKQMPTVSFRLDESLKREAEVYRALDKARTATPSPAADGDEAGGEVGEDAGAGPDGNEGADGGRA